LGVPELRVSGTREVTRGGAVAAIGVNAVKIATIASHTARLIYPRRVSLMRCFNFLLCVGRSLFGSADFPAPGPGKIPQASVRNG
jgi:hypothetical protein